MKKIQKMLKNNECWKSDEKQLIFASVISPPKIILF